MTTSWRPPHLELKSRIDDFLVDACSCYNLPRVPGSCQLRLRQQESSALEIRSQSATLLVNTCAIEVLSHEFYLKFVKKYFYSLSTWNLE